MKIKLQSLLLWVCLTCFFHAHTQDPLKLQYYKQLALKNAPDGIHLNGTFINDKGWLFVYLTSPFDSLEVDDFKMGKETTGSRLMAFDNTGKLRWTFSYNQMNTTQGGMSFFMAGKDNSVYFSCGAKDSLVLNNGFRFDMANSISYTFIGRFDSTGKVTAAYNIYSDLNYTKYGRFSSERYYNYGTLMTTGLCEPFIVDSAFNQTLVYPIYGSRASTIDKDGEGYFAYVIGPTSKQTIIDTTIFGSGINGSYKWVLTKISKVDSTTFKRKWLYVVDNNRDDELQENKLIKVDRNGNVFWAIRHGQEFSINGNIIPFYQDGNTNHTKASIIRFDQNGVFKGAHYDTSINALSFDLKQSIWLEYDKDMNVYAYLFSNRRTYTFDKVYFENTYSDYHRILIFDPNSLSFNKAYTHLGGRFVKSLLPHRHVFYHYLKSSNYPFREGIVMVPKWEQDLGIAVMDTAAPLGPSTSVKNIQSDILSVNVFPNPSENGFFISNANNQKINCVIYSVEMREHSRFIVDAGETAEITTITSPGIYFIRCSDDKGLSQTLKIIKP